jgi:hypothetical protein
MKRIAKVALIGIATAGALLVVGVGALAYLFSGMCGNDLVAEHVSPDGAAKVASLVKPEVKLPSSSGNLFIADTGHGIAPAGPGGGPELRVRWEGPKHVLLQHHAKARGFKIEVRYAPLP